MMMSTFFSDLKCVRQGGTAESVTVGDFYAKSLIKSHRSLYVNRLVGTCEQLE